MIPYFLFVLMRLQEGVCDHLRVIKMQNLAKFKNAVINGVVAIVCARHGFYLPQGIELGLQHRSRGSEAITRKQHAANARCLREEQQLHQTLSVDSCERSWESTWIIEDVLTHGQIAVLKSDWVNKNKVLK